MNRTLPTVRPDSPRTHHLVWALGVALLVLVGLAPQSASAGSKKCLTGTDPEVAGDAPQILDIRAIVDAACPCEAYDGSSKDLAHGKYVSCAAAQIKTEAEMGHLRPSCKGTVKSFYTKSTCGNPPTATKAPCIKKETAGKVSCAIKLAEKCLGQAGKYTQVACTEHASCIEAADTNGDLIVAGPGDDGSCVVDPTPVPSGSPIATPSPSGTPITTPTSDPTETPTSTPMPTSTPAPTETPTITPTSTATPTPTATPLPPDGSTQANAAKSCRVILSAHPSSLDGTYWIDPNGGATTDAFQVRCDMTVDGGGWIELARFGSTGIPIGATTYSSGLGTIAATDYAHACAKFTGLDLANITMRETMGQVRDFYRPTSSNDLCAMLGSSTKHQWSSSAAGTYQTPSYSAGNLGGSAANWPFAIDGRSFIGFWGGPGGTAGCCHASSITYGGAADAPAWGRTFTLHVREP